MKQSGENQYEIIVYRQIQVVGNLASNYAWARSSTISQQIIWGFTELSAKILQ